uniref:Uncharacterized protein n=1 Tax=Chromera velia CCMP2878 TaxID=1169474 RepID=A0A0G4H527_9ALVE|eukprot:Cvel_5692.t1-p1 / transcript=Cvel_5692.t1 / gene=Cvel_5692 / organism=Chromera_velia_CCMP2878 / gene_product=hypothetical protein / transcript_product=hypothetical protein / location=Cvel_scaffold269:46414-47075(-) / protein_length=91 / sequence_SO=supercontig / SO=protein_coding / is_pseudo=false
MVANILDSLVNDNIEEMMEVVKLKVQSAINGRKDKSMCINTCALLVTPVKKWPLNKDYPDLSEYELDGWQIKGQGGDFGDQKEGEKEFQAC